MLTFNEYKFWVSNVACKATGKDRAFLGPMGLNGEAGEVSELFKKSLIGGRQMDFDALLDELGDVLWYYALILYSSGFSLEDVMQRNVEKLVERHGHERP